MPPKHTALGNAAILISRLEKNQMKARLIPPVEKLLRNTGGAMAFPVRMAIANKWLLSPLLIRELAGTPATNALIRTTTAVTMARGSDATNVLSNTAEIVVNFRILPGDIPEEVISHVKGLCQGFDTEIETLESGMPSKISSDESHAFEVMKKAISKVYPGIITTPFIAITGSDSRKYEDICNGIYRLIPVRLNDAEQRSIHNQNEYISIENYRKMIGYFTEVMSTYD